MLRVVGRLLLSISCLLALPSGLHAEDPELPTTVHAVEGLSAEVEILLDRWGVPHIYAESLHDVAVVQRGLVAGEIGREGLDDEGRQRVPRTQWAADPARLARVVTGRTILFGALSHPTTLPNGYSCGTLKEMAQVWVVGC